MDSDKIFFGQYGDFVKNEIRYYLEQMKKDDFDYPHFLESISWLLLILENKVMNQDFGFGSEEDFELYSRVRSKLLEEIEYRETACSCDLLEYNEIYQCWRCQVRECGCNASSSCCGYDPWYNDK